MGEDTYEQTEVLVRSLDVNPLELAMPTATRAFKNGNSRAVRIPADLAYERMDMYLEIERVGDELRIRPSRKSLSGVLSKFAQFSPEFMADGRGDYEQAER